ncbi:hypothetical protein B0H63DRAFT_60814 [Podospora didyma]|uniref:Uncharacterized protein n=1 Tax=Podospora didyma TaxID=330526 RepID=A0AAE0P7R8_9PEZI|nr:hypothetical protein B0H63DRAFT_60814 [Podospora didyma]
MKVKPSLSFFTRHMVLIRPCGRPVSHHPESRCSFPGRICIFGFGPQTHIPKVLRLHTREMEAGVCRRCVALHPCGPRIGCFTGQALEALKNIPATLPLIDQTDTMNDRLVLNNGFHVPFFSRSFCQPCQGDFLKTSRSLSTTAVLFHLAPLHRQRFGPMFRSILVSIPTPLRIVTMLARGYHTECQQQQSSLRTSVFQTYSHTSSMTHRGAPMHFLHIVYFSYCLQSSSIRARLLERGCRKSLQKTRIRMYYRHRDGS